MDFTKLGYGAEGVSFSDVFSAKKKPDLNLPPLGTPGTQGRLDLRYPAQNAMHGPPIPVHHGPAIPKDFNSIGSRFGRFAKRTLSNKKTIAGAAVVGALATGAYLTRDKGNGMNKAASARDLMLASFTGSVADGMIKEALSLAEIKNLGGKLVSKGKHVVHKALDTVEDVVIPAKTRGEAFRRKFERASRDLPEGVKRTLETLKLGGSMQIGKMEINPPDQGKFHTKVMRDEHGNVNLEHFIRDTPTSMHRGMRQGIEGKPMSSTESMLSGAVEPGVVGTIAGGAMGGWRGAIKGGLIGAGYGAYKGRREHSAAYNRGAGALHRMQEVYGPDGPYGLRPVDKPGGTVT